MHEKKGIIFDIEMSEIYCIFIDVRNRQSVLTCEVNYVEHKQTPICEGVN